jgi:hypothetical protein
VFLIMVLIGFGHALVQTEAQLLVVLHITRQMAPADQPICNHFIHTPGPIPAILVQPVAEREAGLGLGHATAYMVVQI